MRTPNKQRSDQDPLGTTEQGSLSNKSGLSRRDFLRATAAAGAGLMITPVVWGQAVGKVDDINVALIGAGAEGQVLTEACLKIPGIRFQAVCDIWEQYNLRRAVALLKRYKHNANSYTDYKEMLAKEGDKIDAVIVATPDFWHAEHANASMKAGKHVYCEKEMSNTLEGAKSILQTACETGKLLQVGHQRRSNPRYIYCYDKLIQEAILLGRITTINGQWNRSKAACEVRECSPRLNIDEDTLKNYGFPNMTEFLNWRMFKGLGGGPIVDLGSHQIDIYAWFLDALPTAVMASGGTDYWKEYQWYDNVMAIFEFPNGNGGQVRAFYQTLTTNSNGGYFETFMGDEGTLTISEAKGRGEIYREPWVTADKWEPWVEKGYIKAPEAEKPVEKPKEGDVRESPKPPLYDLTATLDKPYHQPHLENFFAAVRDSKVKLNCPAQVGYETAVMVLKVNEAIAAGKRLEFAPEDFKV